MAAIRRKGDVLSVHVGRLHVAEVRGMGGTSPTLFQRTKEGYFNPVATLDDRDAERELLRLGDLVEWAIKPPPPWGG